MLELPLAFFLIHRVRQLLRITLMHLYPEGDDQGRPMNLIRLPLLATLSEPFGGRKGAEGTETQADDAPEEQPGEPDGL